MKRGERGIVRPYIGATVTIIPFVMFALIYVGLAIVGAVRTYTPIPIADMWDGSVDFFRKVSEGDWSAWWAPHNEHRIVLARVLFWIDMALFSGNAIFLILANYVLATCSLWVLWRFLSEALPEQAHATFRRCIAAFLTAWLFFWSQEGNLTWAFQSQFILAQLLPLTALFAIYRARMSTTGGHLAFTIACVLGVASLGTMANGVLALPALTVYAAIMRMGWRRVALLGTLSIVFAWIYQQGFSSSDDGGSKLAILRDDPWACLRFLLLYLGSPFYYVARNIAPLHARNIAAGFGALLVLGALVGVVREAVRDELRPLSWALISFLGYIGATAAATTIGRAASGEVHALDSRYTTPAIMAWAALLILCSLAIAKMRPVIRYLVLAALFALLLTALPEQKRAKESHREERFQQAVAVMALDLGVRDETQIPVIYPFIDQALALGRMAADRHLSIFSHAPFDEARNKLGTTLAALPSDICRGAIEEATEVRGDSRFVLIRGWLVPSNKSAMPRPVMFVDGKTVVGYGLIGQRHGDVMEMPDQETRYSGFTGYLQAQAAHRELSVVNVDLSCRFVTPPPAAPFHITWVAPAPELATVTAADVQPENAWAGGDFDHSDFPGMHVYGSVVRSHAITGSITLTAHRGAALFYRSGPTAGRQRFKIDGNRLTSGVMPLANQWLLLRFDDPRLPETFTVTFSTEGTGWGEWSAIAVSDGGTQER